MKKNFPVSLFFALAAGLVFNYAALAATFSFSTGNPDIQMGMASRPGSPAGIEIATADDFLLTKTTRIDQASFTGLLSPSVPVSNITEVLVKIFRVFPKDSTSPPSGRVPTRANSPADAAFSSRSLAAGELSLQTLQLSSSITAPNSVLNGINPVPNQLTGGEGPVSGPEFVFTVTFSKPLILPADHYFFVPQVLATGSNFYWLSAPNPIVSPGTSFSPDFQTWIRNANLQPDWLRVRTDIVGGSPGFNGAFSLTGRILTNAPQDLLLLD